MVTHDQGEAMAISDRILLLNNGRIEQQGTPQSMYQTPIPCSPPNSWAATTSWPPRWSAAMASA
jgi:ABC-type Fe3+/spermidine/putrescine transport system ATPase subunit